jgi:AraC family transcriptional regulator of adaptative response/methylated-DNA-[protein]-cysteine methyltransferase
VSRDPLSLARSLVEETSPAPALEDLARRVGLSAGHLQRRFKARYGLSPREYASAARAGRLKKALRSTGTVARASYDAGFNSSSRVYDSAGANLGMTPADYAKGGAGIEIRHAVVESELGLVLIAVTDRGVCAVLPGRSEVALVRALAEEFPAARLRRVDQGADTFLSEMVTRIAAEITGRGIRGSGVPFDFVGTEFQLRVWKALLSIPRGELRCYADVARAIGRPRSVRAVANAIAHNRLAIVVPCHRVVRSDGSLGGYRWGLPLKRRLVDAERQPG